jgi:hypothetical protein
MFIVNVEGAVFREKNGWSCEIQSGQPFAKSPDEVGAVFWLTAAEIFNHEKAPIWLKESIKDAEAMRERTASKRIESH